jgi:penicillin-binding protein 1A
MSPTVKRRLKKFILFSEILFILIIAAGMGALFGLLFFMNKQLPPESALDTYHTKVASTIWSADGALLAKLADENREPVPLEKIPKRMQDAVIAIEDSRFYKHSGLDFWGLTRAVVANLRGHELSQGASTITQQLARNIYLSPRKTFSRKLKEALLAIQMERNWTKSQILERYLNRVYFGAGAYGVQTAARVYFGKDVRALSLAETAMIAGLPQRPNDLCPYEVYERDHNYDRVKERRDMVLDRMADLGYVTRQDADKARRTPIKVLKRRPPSIGFFRAKYFCKYVVDQLRDRFGYDEETLQTQGLKIVTTLNYKMQLAAERAAKRGVHDFRRGRVSEVAMLSMEPKTGYIRALVGGVHDWETHQFDCATQARRQPGSSFKLFVYATAFEKGDTPWSGVSGTVKPIRMPDGKYYAPKNHGSHYSGFVNYQQAFAASVNGAAVNVCLKVGPHQVKELAQRLGLKGNIRAYPSMALGTSEASPLEMANAYGVFAAGGKRAEPIAILQIRDSSGQLLEDVQPVLHDTGLSPQTVDYINLLTRGVVTSGTGAAARSVPDAHGKTGTTEDSTDAWFVGYTKDLVTAVWAGNRNNTPMASRMFGGTICAPIWASYTGRALALLPGRRQQIANLAPGSSSYRSARYAGGDGEFRPRRRRRRRSRDTTAAVAAPAPAAAESAPEPAPAGDGGGGDGGGDAGGGGGDQAGTE